MKQYIHSVDDAVAVILGNLDDQEYDKLVEEEFEELAEALLAFGEQFVFIDSVHTLSLTQDEYSKHTLQIVSLIYPKQYLCIYFEETGLYIVTVDSKEDVLEHLHAFINSVSALSFDQADAINEIISAYK